MISQGCTLCIKSGSMVLCIGPVRGWGGPIVLVPGGLFWTRRRAVVGFRWVVPDTHDYFLRRPKAGRLHPSSKSGPEPPLCIIAVWLVALRLSGVMFQRLHQNPHHIWCCVRSGWWPCGLIGWCSKKLHQNPHPE